MIHPWLRLLRAGTLFSPAADVLAGACLAGADWSFELPRAMAASAMLYGAGMVLNDHADRATDARRRPTRPIPQGQVRAGTALAVGLALAAAAVALSPIPAAHGTLCVLVLAYDYLVKRAAVPGALLMGVLRAANLASGALLVQALHPGAEQRVAFAAGAYGLYIFAVTLLGVLEDQPRPPARAVTALLTVPPLATFLALLTLASAPVWVLVVAGSCVLAFAARNRRVAAWNAPDIRGAMAWLLLGCLLYTALLCAAVGRVNEGAAIACCVPCARWVGQRIAAT